jgi:Tfp pilus assembly protein PilX
LNIMKQKKIPYTNQGFILPIILITGVVITFIIAAVSSGTLTNNRLAHRGNQTVDAQMTADAGLDYAMNRMNTVANWAGTAGEQTLMSDMTQNLKLTYQVIVADGVDSTHKTLTVTARVYSPASAGSASVTRKYLMDIVAVTSGVGPTSVATGVGGLILNSNAKISGGDVVVNGKITMNNNAQIGLTTNSVNIRAAHQSCPSPANSTYPQVCGSGQGEPITMGTNAKIYANVQAKNQTTGTNMFNPGLVPCSGTNCDPIALPAYDRAAQVAAVSTTYASTDSAIACGNNQTKSWPANVKITGDITTGNDCTVTVNGNTWITGNVTMGNNAKFIVANSLGTTAPTLMVDGGNTSGTGGFRFGNNSQILPNSTGTGMQVVSFWSNSSCSPDCTNLTGTDLYNSQNVVTIDLNNNGSAQNSILWSRWTKVRISNNAALGAVTGQTVELGSNAVINFTASVPGSDNRVTTWTKRGYMRVYQ